MQNYNDILELLQHITKELLPLREISDAEGVNRVSVKNALENMRSVLDYCAQDIRLHLKDTRTKKDGKTHKVYFPYGETQFTFKRSLDKNLPGLITRSPTLHQCLLEAQPFSCRDPWLVNLCRLTNDAKHNGLSKTDHRKTVSLSQGNGAIVIKNATNIQLVGNYVNGRRMDDVYVDQGSEISIARHSGDTFLVENNHLFFRGESIEVIPFLEKCRANIEALVKNIYEILVAQ